MMLLATTHRIDPVSFQGGRSLLLQPAHTSPKETFTPPSCYSIPYASLNYSCVDWPHAPSSIPRQPRFRDSTSHQQTDPDILLNRPLIVFAKPQYLPSSSRACIHTYPKSRRPTTVCRNTAYRHGQGWEHGPTEGYVFSFAPLYRTRHRR